MTTPELVERVEAAIQTADAGKHTLPNSVLKIRGHGSAKVSTFLNTLCGSITDCRYLEFGTFTGRSLVAAAYGNLGSYTGVDKLQWLGSTIRFPDTASLKQYLSDNLKMLHAPDLPNPTPPYAVLEMDTAYYKPEGNYDVFFYDADHSYQPTYDGIKLLMPHLKPGVVIVDDYETHRKSPEIVKAVHDVMPWPTEHSWNLRSKQGWHTGIFVAVIE